MVSRSPKGRPNAPGSRRFIFSSFFLGVISVLGVLAAVSFFQRFDEVESASVQPPLQLDGECGYCLYQQQVLTWENKTTQVCDCSICGTPSELLPLNATIKPERWFTPAKLLDYKKMLQSKDVLGWLHPDTPSIVSSLTNKQHHHSIVGPVGEIGVLHGKFLILLAGLAYKEEAIVSFNLTDTVSKPGRDDFSKMGTLVKKYLGGDAHPQVINSTLKEVKTKLISRQIPLFRFLSINGEHTMEATLSHLNLATCLLREGGILAVDDAYHLGWMGVSHAISLFVASQMKLAPFLLHANKMYFTTASWHESFIEAAMKSPELRCTFPSRTPAPHVSQYSMGPWKVCLSVEDAWPATWPRDEFEQYKAG